MAILRDLTVDLVEASATKPTEEVLSTQERQDLARASSRISEKLKPFFQGDNHLVAFKGYPGSGKTSALREIGIVHALAGKSVLYLSFNKVLATKIRLEITELMSRATAGEYVFNVHDQFQFYKTLAPEANVSNFKQKVLPNLIKQNELGQLPKYDTILIDEAQDAEGELFKVVELVSHEKTSLFIAYGENQHLYNVQRYEGGSSPELNSLISKSQVVQFNRNFRSGPTTQLVCSAISDNFPNVDKAIEWLTAHLNARRNRSSQDALDFGEYIYEPSIQIADTPIEFGHQRFMFNSINLLIESALTEKEELDALIILAGEYSPNYPKILQYLKLMEIPHLDLVAKGNRRTAPKPNELVITTFHGARGLTCRNAIVLDVEILEKKSNDPDRPPINNLLNIALSRARNQTLVLSGLHDNEYAGHEALRFLSALLEILSED
jgi:thymidine kinase